MLRTAFHFLGNAVALLAAFGLLARFVPPHVLWPPAIVALLLPGLLLLTGIYAAIVLLRGAWKPAVVPVITLALSLPILGRIFALGAGPAATADAPQLTVATFNALGFRHYRDRSRVPDERIASLTRALNADVLLVQEAGSGTGKYSRAGVLREHGPYADHFQPEHRAVATFANDLRIVAEEFEEFNGFSVADVSTTLGTIRVINVHLQSNRISSMAGDIGTDDSVGQELDRAESMFRLYGAAARKRARQAEHVREYIRKSPHPVIVGGDVNDVPSSYTYQRLRTPRLRDAWSERGFGLGATFTGPLPGLRIDYLLVDTSLTVVDLERVETGFSDHRALRLVVE